MENKRELALHFYKTILKIRKFEEKIDYLLSRDLIGGTAHLCIGQEAAAVGVISALNNTDLALSTHRGHGHLIAKGADMYKLMTEIMGKSDGYCKGKGGTQHICATDINFIGTNGITGGGIPIATGIGLALKKQRSNRVVVCFFGDGATNQGTFYESMNMASLWKLPVLYVCENNKYAMSTPLEKSTANPLLADKAKAHNVSSITINGMDVFSVYESTKSAVGCIRQGNGPFFIEALTYRYCGHSKSDTRMYRTKAEENEWKSKDPLKILERFLLKNDTDKKDINKISETTNLDIEKVASSALSCTQLTTF